MIHVENLVKRYGPTKALRGITFDVPRGQVLGFLGPNGAGKTTTMKILTGFLYPDSGTATIAGLDVLTRPLEARRFVGYLPESNPLYKEMSVKAYLRFAAEVRGINPGERKASIDRVVGQCGLAKVTGKDVGELSKGFRQRVGLAQAMIHNPEVLVLDEPTSGLDPNQIVEIRSLIKSIGEERTVILSTHYLQEVEATCNRVIIVHNGGIRADGTIPELTAMEPARPIRLGVKGPREAIKAALAEVVSTGNVIESGQEGEAHFFRLVGLTDEVTTEALFDLLVTKNGWKVVELHRGDPHLETVFRKLTGGLKETVAAPTEMTGGAQ